VVLSWQNLPEWIDQKKIYCPGEGHDVWKDIGKKKTGNGAVIAAMIDEAEMFFGIDSGPGHIAACSPIETPVYIIWTDQHPINCFDLAGDNVTHIVSEMTYVDPPAKQYFETHYAHHYYFGDLTNIIEAVVNDVMS